ncbi:glycerophosphodiester phosphodiesterase family protein [Mycobacterium sp. SM1]|uniref:glycerophosphodiester phosphodiesterase family protein n=1 Tax=Mycobacterium sp. SM1 TaxID=2816243 RepID=UPI001F160A8C|nr:glycerophosphodiester phosphodiesterase family protein [Mycobacterium sp. SM1]
MGLPGPPAGAAPAVFDLVAHQGGQGEATGESLRAFAKSLELGVSTLEFDVVITRDGQPLVWHDQRILPQKCADTAPVLAGDPQYPYVGKLVRNLTVAQLRTLDCGKPAGEFPRAEVVWGTKIATLPEVFALADSYRAKVRYDIEAKVDAEHPAASADPREFVDTIIAAARSAGKADCVEIESFDWRVLPMVHQVQPSIPVAALWNETTWAPDSPWLGGIDPAVVGDPILGAMMVGANILSPGYSVPYGQTTRDPGFTLVADKPFVDRAHALGLKVIPWTINDADTMRAQIAAGADGIITDYPALLRSLMARDGMPLPQAYHPK